MVANIINSIIQNADTSNTYLDDEGLLVCKTCGTRRQTRKELLGTQRVLPIMCKCEEEEFKKMQEREKQEQQAKEFERRQKSIAIGYRNIFLTDSDTAIPQAENYIKHFEEFKAENVGLMIWGTVGNGKTFTASIIANELCRKGYKVVMLHITEALSKIGQFDNEAFKNEIADCDLLVLDDFGVSRETEYKNEQLNSLIDIRYSVKKPIIITTNKTREELGNTDNLQLERTYNRLIEMTHPWHIVGESRRKKISQERYKRINDLLNE